MKQDLVFILEMFFSFFREETFSLCGFFLFLLFQMTDEMLVFSLFLFQIYISV